ncbi:MAG TPA: M23 family metallopeptidase [Anaerolineales bacterium]|jgi:murein DD-endopeptidase MepM/ murein hydrolase activator NlpD|nr:M23 family metallopeptidase [Anaerolineales bacterium]HQX15708.1 M23 family metallopeptidase [Anaerolineales bacterium]
MKKILNVGFVRRLLFRSTRWKSKRLHFIFGWVILSLLASCAPALSGSASPTPTAVIAGEADQLPIESEATPRPTIEPFRFILPTPGAEPVSGWRPPLYPIPWAVSSYDHFYFARPIAADNVNWPLAEYRYGGVFFAPNIVHTGVDIDAAEGAPILAAGAGTVVSAGWGLYTEVPGNESDPYGLAVVIRHDFGYKGQSLFTIYAHMSAITAVEGQQVDTGDVIGLVGDTGATTGPHLHFEIRLGKNSFYNTFNPELWMAPPQGWGVLVGRVTDEKGKLLNQYSVEARPLPSEVPLRKVLTYAEGSVNADPYYQENLVLSDLPAGIYKILMEYKDKDMQFFVEIFPGQVTYFTFTDKDGFQLTPPPVPTLNFLPTTATPVP